MCQAYTQPKWYRPNGGKCPFKSLYHVAPGIGFCEKHWQMLKYGSLRAVVLPTGHPALRRKVGHGI